jgi:hypothetical protein
LIILLLPAAVLADLVALETPITKLAVAAAPVVWYLEHNQ